MEAVGGIESAAAQLLHGAAMDSLGASKMEGGGMPGLFQFQTGNLERVIEFLINSVHGLATTVREESAALRSEVEATKSAQALLDKRLDVTLAAQANAQPGEDPGMRLALTELQAAVEAGQQKHDGEIEAINSKLDGLVESMDTMKKENEELRGATDAVDASLKQTEKAMEKGDESERRQLQIEIARVEAEIAALKAMQLEAQGALDSQKLQKQADQMEANAAAKKAEKAAAAVKIPATWLDGLWDTSFGNLAVTDGAGTYGRENPLEVIKSVDYEGLTAKGTWASGEGAKHPRVGTFFFERSEDGKSFTGKYGDGDTPIEDGSDWVGTRLKTPPPVDTAGLAKKRAAAAEAAEAARKAAEEDARRKAEALAQAEAIGKGTEAAKAAAAAAEEARIAAELGAEVSRKAAADAKQALEDALNFDPAAPPAPIDPEDESMLATASIMAGMSDLRIELAESEKRFADVLRKHSEQIDEHLATLKAEIHANLPEVAAVKDALETLKTAMNDKADVSRLQEMLDSFNAKLANTGSAEAPVAMPVLPEMGEMTAALDEIRSGLGNKADIDTLEGLRASLMQKIHDVVQKTIPEPPAPAPAPVANEPAPPPAPAPAPATALLPEGLLDDLAAFRQQLSVTQQKVAEAEDNAVARASETATVLVKQGLEDQIRLWMEAHPEKSDDDLKELIMGKADINYCNSLFQRLEKKLNSAKNQPAAAGLHELDNGGPPPSSEAKGTGGQVFKRTWWEALQIEIKQKASARDVNEMMKAIADIRKTVADAAGQLGQARDSAAGNDAAAMFGDGTIMMSSSLGPGRAFNTRVFNNPSPSMSMGPRPQIHVVVGEFPARSQPRFSRALGGGGAAMRSKEDIGYLQNRLEERLSVLKTMYENKGWGVRSHNILTAAAQVNATVVTGGGFAGRKSSYQMSSRSHQRAMDRSSGGNSAIMASTGHRAHKGRQMLLPLDDGGRASPVSDAAAAVGSSPTGPRVSGVSPSLFGDVGASSPPPHAQMLTSPKQMRALAGSGMRVPMKSHRHSPGTVPGAAPPHHQQPSLSPASLMKRL